RRMLGRYRPGCFPRYPSAPPPCLCLEFLSGCRQVPGCCAREDLPARSLTLECTLLSHHRIGHSRETRRQHTSPLELITGQALTPVLPQRQHLGSAPWTS